MRRGLPLPKWITQFTGSKFGKDLIWVGISQFITAFSALLINVLIGNFYGAEGLGIFSKALAVYMLLYTLGDFGSANSVLKFSAEKGFDSSNRDLILSSAFTIAFSSITIILIVFFCIHYINDSVFYNKETTRLLASFVIGLPFFISNKLMISQLNSMRAMKRFSMLNSARWVFISGFLVLIKVMNGGLEGIPFAFVTTEMILFLIQLPYLIFKLHFKLIIDFESIVKQLKFSSKTILVAFVGDSTNKLDIIISGIFLSNAEIGLVSFALSFTRGLLLIPNSVMINFNPIISNLFHEGRLEELNEYIIKMRAYLGKFALIIAAGAAIIYPFIVKFLLNKPEFWDSLPYFYVLLAGTTIVMGYYFLGSFLTMAGFPEIQLMHVTVMFTYMTLSTFFLVKYFALTGMVMANLSFNIFLIFSLSYFINKKTGIKILKLR